MKLLETKEIKSVSGGLTAKQRIAQQTKVQEELLRNSREAGLNPRPFKSRI